MRMRLAGRTYSLRVRHSDTVASLLFELAKRFDAAVFAECYLTYGGRVLDLAHTLIHYGIGTLSQLVCRRRVLGGGDGMDAPASPPPADQPQACPGAPKRQSVHAQSSSAPIVRRFPDLDSISLRTREQMLHTSEQPVLLYYQVALSPARSPRAPSLESLSEWL